MAGKVKIANISPLPERGGWDVALTLGTDVDHVTFALGQACSAYKVENPIALRVRHMMSLWDRDGSVETPANPAHVIKVRIDRARSDRKCVQRAEFEGACYAHVSLKGEAETVDANGGTRRFPIIADVERAMGLGGFCSNMAGSLAVVSREAVIALINDLALKAGTPEK